MTDEERLAEFARVFKETEDGLARMGAAYASVRALVVKQNAEKLEWALQRGA
jgi:hypothetical protein